MVWLAEGEQFAPRALTMTSILTNTAAIAALQTLRSIETQLTRTQGQVSSGLRIQTAADNAAYWSIATTMRSDNMAISAVADALGMGAAKVDVAYAGLESTVDVLKEFRARLVAAQEPGVDQLKIQEELDQFKDQLVSISASASFNGINWLSTDEQQNLWELSSLPTSIVSSFDQSADGTVHVGTTDIDLTGISLLNVGGGGALQKDPRALGDIGGLRNATINAAGSVGYQTWNMGSPVTLTGAQTITFDLTIDQSSLTPGDTHSVAVGKSTIDAALGTTDGVIHNAVEFGQVLRQAFAEAGIASKAFADGINLTLPGSFFISTSEATGHPGSTVSVSNVVDPTGGNAGGLATVPVLDKPGLYATDQFAFTSPFRVYRDISFSFDLSVDGDAVKTVTVDRDLVDTALGTSDGWINSAADFATVLNVAVGGKGLVISENVGDIVLDIDPALYPNMGARSSLIISNVTDNLGRLVDFDIVDVDISTVGADLDNYLFGINLMLEKAISATSTVGAVKTRIDMQTDFIQTLMDSIEKGIGRLVDADMNEASTRLKAQQTQQQLAIQALQIANSNAENVMQLFR